MRSLLGIVLLGLVAAGYAEANERAEYLLHCGGCHLPDGRGNPPEVPTIRQELGKIIQVPGGREYLVQIPGASQAPVSDARLADIMNWMLTEFNADTLPSNFQPYSEAEVTKARAHTLTDPLKRREEIWKKYPE